MQIYIKCKFALHKMTCLFYKAAKTYKKMIKTKLCWNDLLQAKKNYKIIKSQKNVLYFDRYIRSAVYAYTNALLASAHMSYGWFVYLCQTSR